MYICKTYTGMYLFMWFCVLIICIHCVSICVIVEVNKLFPSLWGIKYLILFCLSYVVQINIVAINLVPLGLRFLLFIMLFFNFFLWMTCNKTEIRKLLLNGTTKSSCKLLILTDLNEFRILEKFWIKYLFKAT